MASAMDREPGHGHGALRPTFEEQLQAAKDDVLRLGSMVEAQLQRAGQALVERDVELADQVRWGDEEVNTLQGQVTRQITAVIARQGPMARDIRELLSLYHAAAELERMGDYAVNIAKLAQQLAGEPEIADPAPDPAHGAALPRAAARRHARAGRRQRGGRARGLRP